jgi:protein-S-isoprenylcysteine O-methyltransferase Ste14
MTGALFSLGVMCAKLLLALLLATLLFPRLRFWPTPGTGTWQSYVWWPLFRGLNVLCFAVAAVSYPGGYLGLPVWLRLAALMLLVVSMVLFVYSFRVLGRDNSYGGRNGLVTSGIYQWSRNPQNAMLIVVYASLALAADSGATYVLCAGMMAVYFLMVLAEEPWLEKAYGEAFRAYRRTVPRFFNWRRALGRA